jgi:hypothetical protein
MWVQKKINRNKVLYGTFYVPPKSNTDSWNKVENSIESAVNDDNIDNIFFDIHNNPSPIFLWTPISPKWFLEI